MDPENMTTTVNQTAQMMEYCSQTMNETLQQAAGMVVYNSQLEKVLSLVVIITMCIFTLLGQFSVVITIMLSEDLREMPHFIVILMCCATDIFMAVAATAMYVWQYSYGCIQELHCRIHSCFGFSVGLSIGNLIGYMALERAVYFCYPMRYEHLFTPRKMAVAMCIIFSMSTTYIVTTEVVIGREYHATMLACNLPSSNLQTGIQFALFLLPAAVITGGCVRKIWKLSSSCSVAPARLNVAPSNNNAASATLNPPVPARASAADPAADGGPAARAMTSDPVRPDGQTAHHSGNNAGTAAEMASLAPAHPQASPSPAVLPSPGPGFPSVQAKKAFRMIVLVSGTFWVTFLPAYIIRVIVFMSGYTWIDLDTRAYPVQALMMRLGIYGWTSVSSLFNPIIYFYSRKDLRREFWRLLGFRSNAVTP